MPWIALAPSVAAAVLSRSSTAPLVIAIANVIVSFFAINTILNLGTQQETGDMTASFDAYKNGAVAALTASLIIALVLIVVAIA